MTTIEFMLILLQLLISVVALLVLLVGGWAFGQVATAHVGRSATCLSDT